MIGILKRNAMVVWQFMRYSCVYKCADGSCGSLFYWYIIMHERECVRERGASRRVGGWVKGAGG